MIKKVVIDVEKDNATIHRVEITDLNSNVQTITVQSLKLDAKLPDSAFDFTPPEGTSIVDLR